jgi:hypothetical protein
MIEICGVRLWDGFFDNPLQGFFIKNIFPHLKNLWYSADTPTELIRNAHP